jgi:hypothetical protein
MVSALPNIVIQPEEGISRCSQRYNRADSGHVVLTESGVADETCAAQIQNDRGIEAPRR